MSRSIPSALQNALNSRSTTLCLCWKAVRKDGTVFGFTDHDVDVTFGGVTFEAATSFTGSAIEDQLGLAVSNVDLMAALSSDGITDADLEDGRWDEANITIYAVDWTDPVNGHAIMVKGTTGQVSSGDLAFQAELRSLGQHFAQYIGTLCQENCASNMFDTGSGLEGGCNFAQPAAVDGVIATVTSRTSFSVTAAGTFPDGTKGALSGGYFAYGTVTFVDDVTGGANHGISREVFTSTESLNFVTLLPFPEDIAIGDAVKLQFGCDKTLQTCVQNFNNILNFRGQPYVPGTDFVFKVNGE